MAKAVEQHWPRDAPLSGLVITRYAHGYAGADALKRVEVIEAGHPVPDESGEKAAREIMHRVRQLGSGDLLLALVSGGGSALLSLPVEGISMADLKATTRELLRCGAPIQDMNTVRKHISLIQGGKLAAMCRAPILSLVISDVTGDAPTHIASGPTVPDPTTYADAIAILARYGCVVTGKASSRAPGIRYVRRDRRNTQTGRADIRPCGNPRDRHREKKPGSGGGVFSAADVTPMVLGDDHHRRGARGRQRRTPPAPWRLSSMAIRSSGSSR